MSIYTQEQKRGPGDVSYMEGCMLKRVDDFKSYGQTHLRTRGAYLHP